MFFRKMEFLPSCIVFKFSSSLFNIGKRNKMPKSPPNRLKTSKSISYYFLVQLFMDGLRVIEKPKFLLILNVFEIIHLDTDG